MAKFTEFEAFSAGYRKEMDNLSSKIYKLEKAMVEERRHVDINPDRIVVIEKQINKLQKDILDYSDKIIVLKKQLSDNISNSGYIQDSVNKLQQSINSLDVGAEIKVEIAEIFERIRKIDGYIDDFSRKITDREPIAVKTEQDASRNVHSEGFEYQFQYLRDWITNVDKNNAKLFSLIGTFAYLIKVPLAVLRLSKI